MPLSLTLAQHRRIGAVIFAGLAAAVVLAVTTTGGGDTTSTRSGPTTTAQRRDLAVTSTADGQLERSGERTIVHLRGGNGGTGGSTSTGAATPQVTGATPASDVSAQSATNTATLVAFAQDPSTTTTVPPTTTTPSTTTSPTTTTPTWPAPPTSSPPTTSPPATGSPNQPSGPTTQPATPALGEAPPSGQTGAEDPDVGAVATATETLTSITAVGTIVDQGTVLYSGDREPIVAIVGDDPMWRTLDSASAEGSDVHQLEEALVALGFGDGLTPDDDYTSSTAAAVKAWEESLGRQDPDGTVGLGDLVAVPADARVSSVDAHPGDQIRAGSTILHLTTPTQVVIADVPQSGIAQWAPGTEVSFAWDDDTTATGLVYAVGRDATIDADGGSTVEVTIALRASDDTHANGTPVAATVGSQEITDALAVPLAAIVASEDGRAAVVVPGDSEDRLVEVTLGLQADGWIEVAGIDEGTELRLPG